MKRTLKQYIQEIINEYSILIDIDELYKTLKTNKIRKSDLKRVINLYNRVGIDINFNTIIKGIIHYRNNPISSSDKRYNPTYIAKMCNISLEAASNYIVKFKTDKSTSESSFIKRWGEDIGKEKFKKFQDTSRYSSSDERYQKIYGQGWRAAKKDKMRGRTRKSKYFWIKKGFNENDAIKLSSFYQRAGSGVHREYWVNRGLTDTEIDFIMKSIDKKKGEHKRNLKWCIEKYGINKGRKINEEALNCVRAKMEDYGEWTPLDELDEFVKYKKLVWMYTRRSVIVYDIDDIDKRSYDFHLDHRYSIKMGFKNNIEPQIIGSIVNLEIISQKENCAKQDKCSISLQYLIDSYNKLKKEEINENI